VWRTRSLGGLTLVMVMESADFRYRDHPASVSQKDGARLGTIHGQRQMGPPAVIIGNVAGQDALEMLLMQDEHMIQALAPDTPNQTLDVRVLPRTLWGDAYFVNALYHGRGEAR
jgi:hypothetical protein